MSSYREAEKSSGQNKINSRKRRNKLENVENNKNDKMLIKTKNKTRKKLGKKNRNN